jgi:hypothetical protein
MGGIVPGGSIFSNGSAGELHQGWRERSSLRGDDMLTLLLIILLLMAVGALPTWPYSRSWGYYPSGGLGIILIVMLVLLLMGQF